MGAAPGWYDAGTPGRLRWWDGAQWTPHETDVPAAQPNPAPVTPAARPAAAPADAPGSGPQPGWYVPARQSDPRWWDGRKWTGSRIRNGTPGVDWATAEQPSFAWVLASLFLVIALMQVPLSILSPGMSWVALPSVLLVALWTAVAVQTTRVHRMPPPSGAALTPEAVRPLPGEQHAAGAGWYPVSATTSRWWTGARWSHYTGTKYGIRPTFHGPRAQKVLRGVGMGVFALAGLAVVAGAVLVAVGVNNLADSLAPVIGWVLIVGAVLFAVVGVVSLALMKQQTRVLLLPAEAPRA